MKQSTEAAIQQHVQDGIKFEDSEVTSDLAEDAIEWMQGYKGTFSYVLDMKTKANLSAGQVRGLLNCMLSEERNKAKKAEEAAKPFAFKAIDRPKGYYTVVLDSGARHTIRIRHGKGDNEEVQYISYMTGPDNEHSYTYCGKVVDGAFRYVPGNFEPTLRQALEYFLGGTEDDLAKWGEAFALESNHCYRCNHRLTVPVSIHRGLGPECAKVMAA